jgi:hypothetical protein
MFRMLSYTVQKLTLTKVGYFSKMLTTWRSALLEKPELTQPLKKFQAFYGAEGSLPRSQQPATDPYPEPDEYSRHPHILFP